MKNHLLTLLIATTFSAHGAESMFVQSAKAKLLDKPSFSAKTIKEIEKGDAVVVEKKEERWLRVNHGGKSGWISILLISPQKPVNKISVLGDTSGVSDNARRRASAVITAGATRGLSAEDRQRVGDTATSDFAALSWVEAISITSSQVAEFESGELK